ncbi:prepilin peptidase [Rhodococcus gannanensis]|uniref:Prepilin peptidase n=1 Tax=Rhodococcus gannanensis TaxID=1960308 RepID=A0ABW4PA14_9NOCA
MGETVAFAGLVVWCGWLSVVDLRTRRLPNALTLPGAVVVLVVAALHGDFRPAVVGALLLSGGYLLTHLVSPSAMGGGDVKLAFGLGAATGVAGAQAWFAAAVGAFVLTAVIGVGLRVAGRGSAGVPHGPSMCLATLAALAAVSV